VGRVLAVDWVPSHPGRPEGLIVVYDGGIFANRDVEAITVPAGELSGFAFVYPGEVADRVTPLVARRIGASLRALAAGAVASLENGCPSG
jgi:8-oxo-dGTP diphosphatase